jgi:aminopeptidase
MTRLEQSADECVARLDLAAEEEVAILADTDTDERIWRALFTAVHKRGAQPTVVIMTPRAANGLEPTIAAGDALEHAAVVFAITGASATHTKALKVAAQNGARVCSMPGINIDILESTVMTPDYDAMRRLGDRLAELFAPAEWMHVTTRRGTDLRVAMGGWSRMPMIDDAHFESGMIANLPAGEALIVPWEGASEGVVVVDLAVSCYPRVLTDPVTIVFAKGRVESVLGDSEPAERVRTLLRENGDNAPNFAEMAIGINPNARNTGVLIETEKQFGTAHIGIGNSANIGGTVWAPIHIDVIFEAPTISVDGRVILADGVFPSDLTTRDSYRSETPLPGSITVTDRPAVERSGRLVARWRDIQGRSRESQVGDEETAARATGTYERLRTSSAITAEDRRVAAVMKRYGLVS